MDYVSPPGVTEKRNLSHQGINREYWLHVPDELPESALWIVMHGYSDGAESRWTGAIWSLADEKNLSWLSPRDA